MSYKELNECPGEIRYFPDASDAASGMDSADMEHLMEISPLSPAVATA